MGNKIFLRCVGLNMDVAELEPKLFVSFKFGPFPRQHTRKLYGEKELIVFLKFDMTVSSRG